MELIISNPTNDEFIKKINWNFDELKSEIESKIAIYNNFVYSPENLKAAKADRANLNRLKKAIDEKRKEIKKLCLKPYEEFESEVKQILDIIDEPITKIDTQIKTEEEKEKKQKRAKLEIYYIENYGNNLGKEIKLQQFFNEKWLNKSCTLKKAQEEIDENVKRFEEDIETLNDLPDFSFEAKKKYLQSLDINSTLNFVNELMKMQKQKAEVPKEKQEEKVYKKDVPRQWINFSAYLSLEEAKALNKFLKENKIEIKRI